MQHGRVGSENVGRDRDLTEVHAFRLPICVVELVRVTHLSDGLLQTTTWPKSVTYLSIRRHGGTYRDSRAEPISRMEPREFLLGGTSHDTHHSDLPKEQCI
jgi:hypothetical protein